MNFGKLKWIFAFVILVVGAVWAGMAFWKFGQERKEAAIVETRIQSEVRKLFPDSILSYGDDTGLIGLRGVVERLDNKEFKLKKMDGEVIAVSKLALVLRYTDPTGEGTRLLRVVLLAQLPDGKLVVPSTNYKILRPESAANPQAEEIESFFAGNLKQGKFLTIGYHENYQSIVKYLDWYQKAYPAETDNILIYDLHKKYLEGLDGDSIKLMEKRWDEKTGFLVPVHISRNGYRIEGTYVKDEGEVNHD